MNSTDKPVSTPKRSRFLNMLAGYGSANAAAQFMKMLFMLIMARYFGLEDYSDYVAAYSLTSFTAIFFNLGLDTWLLREGSLRENWKLSAQKVLSLKASIGLIWAGLLIGLAPTVRPDLFGFGLLALCVADVWFESVLNTMLSVLNIRREIKAYSVFVLVLYGLKLASLFVIMVVSNHSIILIAGLRAFISGIVLIIVYYSSKINFRIMSLENNLQTLRLTIPFNISEIFSIIYMQADVNLLTLLQGKIAAGVYAPALSGIVALFVFPSSVYSFTIPTLSRTFQEKPENIKNITPKFLFRLGMMGIIMFLIVKFFGYDVVKYLLGSEFEVTAQLVSKLSPVLFIKCLEFGLASIIVSIGKQNERLIPQVTAAITNIGFNLWLIPMKGVFGAASVYIGSELVLLLGYNIILIKYFRGRSNEEDK